MKRYYYGDSIAEFLNKRSNEILGSLLSASEFPIETTQRDAWTGQIEILKSALAPHRTSGHIYFEYAIPRLGSRIDVIALVESVVFVLEFKVNETEFTNAAIDQVCDYALDLKNFHEPSHNLPIAPVLIATNATTKSFLIEVESFHDRLLKPIKTNAEGLSKVIDTVIKYILGDAVIASRWESGRYCPTPTIIEAATSLYNGHSVEQIARSEATAINLTETSDAISSIIASAKSQHRKAVCFVTGVPGAGKTLVGLNIATKHIDQNNELYSVFLSGNGPLVAILREALARDKIRRQRERGKKCKKGETLSEVKAFIQNVHHFRDDCLIDASKPPVEHVALFDEAQRAWNKEQTAAFMLRKKKVPNFSRSEPEFLISCLDRHNDWAVVVCLVGGGQEINTGEAGISEWIDSILRTFPDWHIYISSRLTDSEYAAGHALERLASRSNVEYRDELHLAVSMRSFRAENVSLLVKQILDLELDGARKSLQKIGDRYPIVVTRNLETAKSWLKQRARGSERFGIVVSSEAQRLKPYAIDVRTPMDPVHWFLDGKDDVRSSFYLEDVATEFHVQGLELDWACVVWDGDFRRTPDGWEHWSFSGARWNRIRKAERKTYLKNAYRVLLTRARQGIVIVVPEGDVTDPTRDPEFYNATFEYLAKIGFSLI